MELKTSAPENRSQPFRAPFQIQKWVPFPTVPVIGNMTGTVSGTVGNGRKTGEILGEKASRLSLLSSLDSGMKKAPLGGSGSIGQGFWGVAPALGATERTPLRQPLASHSRNDNLWRCWNG